MTTDEIKGQHLTQPKHSPDGKKLGGADAASVVFFYNTSTQAGLVGSVMSFEGIYQSTPTSDVQRIGVLTTVEVSATEVEFPMLGDLDLNVPGIFLINASLDVGDDYVEFDYDNAGSGSFLVGYQNTAILRFDRDAALTFTGAEIKWGQVYG